MYFKKATVLFFYLSLSLLLNAQSQPLSVRKSSFSSDRYDEFCPVYYNGGLVFTSDRNPDVLYRYSGYDEKGFFKIFYTDTVGDPGWRDAVILSKTLKSVLNDGPATFDKSGTTIYFARNIYTKGKLSEISNPRNTLGVFYSRFEESGWSEPREIRFNSEWYNITSPALSPDGSRLYFASDKAGGYGGSDIYYCYWEKGYWSDPVNLGPVVNTKGNEAYPFITAGDIMFFASDGHPGLGGKDIFVSRLADSVWSDPIHLDAPINSPSEDFALIADPLIRKGYFSTNREGSYDIFSFSYHNPPFFFNDRQKENILCFTFTDNDDFVTDQSSMLVEWDFGDSTKAYGDNPVHCYPDAGTYSVRQYVSDKASGRRIFLKKRLTFEIHRIVQPYISSDDYVVAGESLKLDGSKSYVPGYTAEGYYWNFGDGTTAEGSSVIHTFEKSGEYKVSLGLLLRDTESRDTYPLSVYKIVKVVNTSSEKSAMVRDGKGAESRPVNPADCEQVALSVVYNADDELKNGARFQVVVSSSEKKMPASNFSTVSWKYYIREIYKQNNGVYDYVADESSDFLYAYKTYSDLIRLGYSNSKIITIVPDSQAEKDLNNLLQVFGNYSEIFFIPHNARLSSGGYAFLDQVAALLLKYPESRLLIESHTDKEGSAAMNLQLSRQRAAAMAGYLAGKGIDQKRIVVAGYGDLRLVVTGGSDIDRRANQRIEFFLL